jgi:hypothetical protein
MTGMGSRRRVHPPKTPPHPPKNLPPQQQHRRTVSYYAAGRERRTRKTTLNPRAHHGAHPEPSTVLAGCLRACARAQLLSRPAHGRRPSRVGHAAHGRCGARAQQGRHEAPGRPALAVHGCGRGGCSGQAVRAAGPSAGHAGQQRRQPCRREFRHVRLAPAALSPGVAGRSAVANGMMWRWHGESRVHGRYGSAPLRLLSPSGRTSAGEGARLPSREAALEPGTRRPEQGPAQQPGWLARLHSARSPVAGGRESSATTRQRGRVAHPAATAAWAAGPPRVRAAERPQPSWASGQAQARRSTRTRAGRRAGRQRRWAQGLRGGTPASARHAAHVRLPNLACMHAGRRLPSARPHATQGPHPRPSRSLAAVGAWAAA